MMTDQTPAAPTAGDAATADVFVFKLIACLHSNGVSDAEHDDMLELIEARDLALRSALEERIAHHEKYEAEADKAKDVRSMHHHNTVGKELRGILEALRSPAASPAKE